MGEITDSSDYFNNIFDSLCDNVVPDNINMCIECDTKLVRKDTQYCVCPKCGLQCENDIVVDHYSNDIMCSYNNNGQSHISFKVVGHSTSAKIQNNKLMGFTSEYSILKEKKIQEKLNKCIYQINDNEDSVPQNVIDETARKYSQLQDSEEIVKRAGGLSAILASLMYNNCIELNVPRKPKTIVNIFGIQDKQLSEGDKMLRRLAQNGALDIPTGCGEYTDYIDQYFEKLKLDKYNEYKAFILELIDATSIDKIRVLNNTARPTTRCAGALSILCDRLNIPITKDQISVECDISKSTFMRFILMVEAHKNNAVIANIFKKYKVPEL